MGSPTCAGLCPAGYACAGAGVADPVLCPTGTYCPAGSATPLPCSEGTYGAAEGLGSADECTPCPRGSYCSAGQRNACPQGTYNEAAGQAASTACVSCMPRASTATEASASEADCECMADYYLTIDRECEACSSIDGVSCALPGSTLASLPIEPNWWRLSDATTDVADCTIESASGTKSACVGGSGSAAREAGSGVLATVESTGAYCLANHSGPLCTVCDLDDYYYDTVEARCRECPPLGAPIGGIVGVVIGVLSVWYALAALHRLQPTGLPVLTPLARLLRRIGIYCEDIGWQAKSKILISFLQVQCVPAPLTQRTYGRATYTHARALSSRR